MFVFSLKKGMKGRKLVNLARFLGALLGTTPLVLSATIDPSDIDIILLIAPEGG